MTDQNAEMLLFSQNRRTKQRAVHTVRGTVHLIMDSVNRSRSNDSNNSQFSQDSFWHDMLRSQIKKGGSVSIQGLFAPSLKNNSTLTVAEHADMRIAELNFGEDGHGYAVWETPEEQEAEEQEQEQQKLVPVDTVYLLLPSKLTDTVATQAEEERSVPEAAE
jgi:hypothetical protein